MLPNVLPKEVASGERRGVEAAVPAANVRRLLLGVQRGDVSGERFGVGEHRDARRPAASVANVRVANVRGERYAPKRRRRAAAPAARELVAHLRRRLVDVAVDVRAEGARVDRNLRAARPTAASTCLLSAASRMGDGEAAALKRRRRARLLVANAVGGELRRCERRVQIERLKRRFQAKCCCVDSQNDAPFAYSSMVVEAHRIAAPRKSRFATTQPTTIVRRRRRRRHSSSAARRSQDGRSQRSAASWPNSRRCHRQFLVNKKAATATAKSLAPAAAALIAHFVVHGDDSTSVRRLNARSHPPTSTK